MNGRLIIIAILTALIVGLGCIICSDLIFAISSVYQQLQQRQQPTIKGDRNQTLCEESPPGLVGRVPVNKQVSSIEQIEKENPYLQMGGRGSPTSCISRSKVALIIPYRDRPDQLKVFLRHMHPFLTKQKIEYGIYVINQSGSLPFNKASLMNIGFVEAMKEVDWDCAIFHDVDLIPEDDRNLYSCPSQPRHMSVAVDKFNYGLPYKALFGGVTAILAKQFRQLNGYSNQFWGWGAEDDDMAARLKYHKLRIQRYAPQIARYTMLKHQQAVANKRRYGLLRTAHRRFKSDGLNNLKFTLLSKQAHKSYTNINVKLTMPKSRF